MRSGVIHSVDHLSHFVGQVELKLKGKKDTTWVGEKMGE
jgi:hypothetical protein